MTTKMYTAQMMKHPPPTQRFGVHYCHCTVGLYFFATKKHYEWTQTHANVKREAESTYANS